jgi:hypothetical protein
MVVLYQTRPQVIIQVLVGVGLAVLLSNIFRLLLSPAQWL